MAPRYEAGSVDSFAVMFGAQNILHVVVETSTDPCKTRMTHAARSIDLVYRG